MPALTSAVIEGSTGRSSGGFVIIVMIRPSGAGVRPVGTEASAAMTWFASGGGEK